MSYVLRGSSVTTRNQNSEPLYLKAFWIHVRNEAILCWFPWFQSSKVPPRFQWFWFQGSLIGTRTRTRTTVPEPRTQNPELCRSVQARSPARLSCLVLAGSVYGLTGQRKSYDEPMTHHQSLIALGRLHVPRSTIAERHTGQRRAGTGQSSRGGGVGLRIVSTVIWGHLWLGWGKARRAHCAKTIYYHWVSLFHEKAFDNEWLRFTTSRTVSESKGYQKKTKTSESGLFHGIEPSRNNYHCRVHRSFFACQMGQW
jgi:hypothetical protein